MVIACVVRSTGRVVVHVDGGGGENAVVFTVRRKARRAVAPCNRDQRLGDTQLGIYGGVTAYHVYKTVIVIVGTRDDATVVRHIDERNVYRDAVQCTVPQRRRQRYRARMCAHGPTSRCLPPALPLNTTHCGGVLRVALDPQDAAVGGRRSGGAATTAANRNHRVAVCPPYAVIQQQQQ